MDRGLVQLAISDRRDLDPVAHRVRGEARGRMLTPRPSAYTAVIADDERPDSLALLPPLKNRAVRKLGEAASAAQAAEGAGAGPGSEPAPESLAEAAAAPEPEPVPEPVPEPPAAEPPAHSSAPANSPSEKNPASLL